MNISESINERILKIINDDVANVENSVIAKQWVRGKDWDLEYAVEILEE